MARIRSIKPEFWTDGKIKRLPKPAALFFIALWTIADDYGYFPLDSLELSLKAPLWRSQDVLKTLRTIHRAGLIKCSPTDGAGFILGWEHQKIKDRRASKWKDSEIKWDESFSDAPESPKKSPGEERIGEDRRGEDVPARPRPTRTPAKPTPLAIDPAKELRAKTWDSYSLAYSLRYNTEPVRNRTVNSQIKTLVERLGDEAPEVASFYVNHSNAYYVRSMHPIGLCLKDAEGLRTQWATGRLMTQREAHHADEGGALASQLDRIERGLV